MNLLSSLCVLHLKHALITNQGDGFDPSKTPMWTFEPLLVPPTQSASSSWSLSRPVEVLILSVVY